MKRTWYCILLGGCTMVCQSGYKEKVVPFGAGVATVTTCAASGACGYALTKSVADYILPQEASKKCAAFVAALTTAGVSWSVGSYIWHMWYMICSKERQSLLIAKELLAEIDLYMQYLHVIKIVHEKLDQLGSLFEKQLEKNMDMAPVHRIALYCQGVTEKVYNFLQQVYDMGVSYDMPDVVRACSSLLGQRAVPVDLSVDCEHVCPDIKRSYVTIMSILRTFDTNEFDREASENLQKAVDGLMMYWDMFVDGLHRQIEAKILYCQRLCVIESVISLHIGYQLGQTVLAQSEPLTYS